MTITLDSQGTNMADRNDVIPKDYCGIELSDHTIQLLTRLSQVSFSFKATGKKKTLQIWGPELQHGYIDSTVYQKKDLIGYRFPLANGNACPENLKDEDKLAAQDVPRKHGGYITVQDPIQASSISAFSTLIGRTKCFCRMPKSSLQRFSWIRHRQGNL